MILFYNRLFIFARRHVRELFKAFGKILRRIKLQHVCNLRKVILSLTDKAPGFFNLSETVVFHNAAGLIQGKQIFDGAFTLSHIPGNDGDVQLIIQMLLNIIQYFFYICRNVNSVYTVILTAFFRKSIFIFVTP